MLTPFQIKMRRKNKSKNKHIQLLFSEWRHYTFFEISQREISKRYTIKINKVLNNKNIYFT